MDKQFMCESNWREICAKALQLPKAKKGSQRYYTAESDYQDFYEIPEISFLTMFKNVVTLRKDGAVFIEGECLCFLTPAKMLMLVLAFLPPEK